MLRQYGPDVPEASLKKLVTAFSELRQMADEGLIAYPYSTREVVNIVKHLQVRKVFQCEVVTTSNAVLIPALLTPQKLKMQEKLHPNSAS